MQIFAEKVLSALSHATGIGIVWRAGWNWDHADAGGNNLVLGRGGGDLGCGDCAGEGEDDYDGSDEMFHSGIPLKLYLRKKIFLDKPDEVTIGYRME